MSLDIGIDFTVNDKPPREVVLTDWEHRLVVHCIGLYRDVAAELEDCTLPIATSTLKKLAAAEVAEASTAKQSRKRARAREMAAVLKPRVPVEVCGHADVDWLRPFDAEVGPLSGKCRTCESWVARETVESEWRAVA